MFTKLSLKIGFLFFACILLIESLLFYTLYATLVNDRVDEVMESLLARGETHSAVLASSFEEETIEHVGMMEAASSLIVIVTDAKGQVLIHSDPIEPEMNAVINNTNFLSMPAGGKVVETHWNEKRYIASDSPVMKDGEHLGHVFMFSGTEGIARMVGNLQQQFFWIGVMTVVLTVVTIMGLSRLITLPLIRMKKATEQLSLGNHHVNLMIDRNDELGELAASITKLSQDLDQLKKTRHEFLGSISHELRTPLTYIKGYSDILNRPGLSESEKEKYAAVIQEETARLTGFIQELFELAKMDRHEFHISKKEESLDVLLESTVHFVSAAFAREGKSLSVSGDKGTRLLIDMERMQQVLLNLLDNARKYSEAGSRVSIIVSEKSDEVTIQVRDEGIGIPKEEIPLIFGRLYRVEKSRSRESGGFGIGLSIAKEIVEAHGGLLEIHSEMGIGTEATIRLKRKEDQNG
ncbi:HAMP domain-containing histidine kinase [Domibacillus sp. PGB-M46]|uniref:sensor histidine kinase n=1 Tax=Domibacillus sp. PGB-M46 TaxID=2910255 RepID=UPI001F5654AE|nr:HAMP domain-containing sensor histidine kinase [Domibacillus sp. PGB-M46]MCI2256594.1 HAMP domain-containing histidine kinase [Domibacillus sp. PGB-M46]